MLDLIGRLHGAKPEAAATLGFVNLGHAYAHLFMLLFPTAVLAIEQAWGQSYAELLPLGFAGYLLFGLGSLPAGWLGDRWNSRAMMALFFLGTGGATILTGLATGPWMLAAGLTLIGLFASIYHPVAIAWLVGATETPGRALGANGVYGALGTGGAALVAGLLADLAGWRAAFLVPGLVCLATGLAFVIGTARGKLRMDRASYARPAGGEAATSLNRGLFLLFGAILFAGLVFQMMSVGLPKIFQARLGDTIGFSATAAGTLVSLVYLISALGQIAGGLLADRFEERRVYLLSYAVQVLLLAAAAATGNLLLVLIVALAVTVQTGTQPVENCLIASYTPEAWRATVYGAKFVLALGLSALGVPLLAWSYGASGDFAWAFLLMLAFCLVPILVSLALPARRAVVAEPVPAE
jgi:MFS family permease